MTSFTFKSRILYQNKILHLNANNSIDKCGKSIKFYRLPWINGKLKYSWTKFCGISKNAAIKLKTGYVCGKHFKDDDYYVSQIDDNPEVKRLKKTGN
jgi:hypothetical protein